MMNVFIVPMRSAKVAQSLLTNGIFANIKSLDSLVRTKLTGQKSSSLLSDL